MKKTTSKKVLNYAAISAAILGTANATGQVMYTDIDDVTIDTGDVFQPIDFNNDGTVDILVGLLQFNGGPGAIANGADAANSFNGNGIAGAPAGGFYYPSNLTSGTIVDGGTPMLTSVRGDMYVYACYSNSLWCGGVTDGYLGASFDVGGNTHYGWVRLDVTDNGAGGVGTMVIKDFAFDATPDTGVTTGDQGLGLDDQAFNGFDYYVNNNVLNLSATTAMERLSLFNVLGQEVLAQKLQNTNEAIDLSGLKTGVYIANVVIEGQNKSVKIAVK